MVIKRTQTEIDDVMNQAFDGQNEGSKFSGLSYEEGIIGMYDWLVGNSDDNPMEG